MAKTKCTTSDIPAPVFIPREDRSPQRIVVSTKNIEEVKEAQASQDWKKQVIEASRVKAKAKAEAKAEKEEKAEKLKVAREEAAEKRKENAAKKKG